MNLRVKAAFWGFLIGTAVISCVCFAQTTPVSPAPMPMGSSVVGVPGSSAPVAPAVPPIPVPSTALPYYPSPTMPSGVAPSGQVLPQAPGVAPVSKGQVLPAPGSDLSPIEQYVSGKIPQTLTFDIKQFGYDLFFPTSGTAPLPSYAPAGGVPQGYTPMGGVPQSAVPQGYGPPVGGIPQAPVPQGYAPPASTPVPQGYGPPVSGIPQAPVPQGYAPPMSTTVPQGYPPSVSGVPQLSVPQGYGPPVSGVPQESFPQALLPQGAGTMGQPAPAGAAGGSSSFRSTVLARTIPNIPVGPDYVVGPGDEVRISVWGSIEGAWSAEVDRDGNINVPKLGTLSVTGLSFGELKALLQVELSKYYKDFQMNVTMGTLRTMTVYVVGNALAPGAYAVSSLSTIINALVVAGGPSKAGTMRDIQLKRNGDTIAHLDLYDFLIAGDKSKDIRLLPEDVVFIPPIGPIVGVAGNVDRPAIYEIKGRTMLSEGLRMAGGVTAAAHLQRVQVERVHQRQTKVILDVNFEKFKGKQDIPLQDGDIVKVFPILSLVTNKVVLQGNVKRPGDYEWRPGMRARDLLPNADSLLPDSFLDYALITRLVLPDGHQEYRSFDLGALVLRCDPEQNIPLEPYDMVTVFNKWELLPKERVRITGAVNRPGEFDFRPNMKVSDLLKLAGGLGREAFRAKAELTRVTPLASGPLTQQIIVNPEEALAGNSADDIALQADDYLFIRAVPDWHLYRRVRLTGEVNFPGEYALNKGERLASLLDRAGGFTDKAYHRGTQLTRQSIRDLQQQQLNDMIARMQQELLAMSAASVAGSADLDDAQIMVAETKQKQAFLSALKEIKASGRMVVNVDEARRARNSTLNVEMEDGDTLHVPTNPQSVQVIGAVLNQSNFVYVPTKDYSYYIDRAGGFSRVADKGQVYIVKVDGSTITPGWGLFWSSSSNQWESGSPGLIEAGDTIVVPVEVERIAWLRNLKDWAQIIYQTTLGGAVLWKIFND